MRIFFLTRYGDGMGSTPRLIDEGNEVIVFIKEKLYQGLYDGCATKITDINKIYSMPTAKDLVISDCIGFGEVGDALRARGVPVYGAQKIADKMEDDRFFGLEIMAKCGVKVPLTTMFTNHKDGIAYLKKNPGRYVYKPFGFGTASADTYISEDEKDMISFMGSQDKNTQYILQVFIKGLEYSTEMFFSKGEPVSPSFHTIEDKKAYAGDEGPNTGCMDTVQIADKDLNNKAVENGIGKCFEYLKSIKYTGNLDMNSIIDEQGNLWGLEWTCRDGWSSTFARNEMIKGKVSDVYLKIARGEAKDVKLKEGVFGLSVRGCCPPYPYEHEDIPKKKETAGKKINIKPHSGVNYNFYDVKVDKIGLVTAGCSGIILEVSTSDKDILKGRERIFNAMDDIHVADLWKRVDAFDRALKQIPEVDKAGYYEGPKIGDENGKL